jgi:hypothetical protein
MTTSQICQKMIIAVIGAHGLKISLARMTNFDGFRLPQR